MSRLKDLYDRSLQGKISSIYIFANLLVCLANVLLILGMSRMSGELELVYQDNLSLNELSEALDSVQSDMTEYLNVKTTDSLENYYRSSQEYLNLLEELPEEVTDSEFSRMKRNIRNMSDDYLDLTEQTIEAKRGRIVEKYRVRYESATQYYEYISDYIYSLNQAQFKSNSENYNALAKVFRIFESISLGIMFIVIVVNVIFIMKLVGAIIRPLKVLAKAADTVARGDLEIEQLEVLSKDEIGVVTGAFNQMVISIREYIDRLRDSLEKERIMQENELRMEAHLKDAKLKYLQAQINPHFLFNTLNAGAQLAMMEGADRTYEYVQNVAEFFRYNVKKGKDVVELREEIELVDNYIYILNVRFSGDIHYEKDVDPDLLVTMVPSMTLQPIVENCVNHGIREMAGEGRIWLSVYARGDMTCISIRDNGSGMSDKTIEKVLNGSYRADSGETNGIGMDNVIARLRIFTGKEDVIAITSPGKDKGTETIICIEN